MIAFIRAKLLCALGTTIFLIVVCSLVYAQDDRSINPAWSINLTTNTNAVSLGQSIERTSDRSFLVVGCKECGQVDQDGVVCRITSQGKMVWDTSIEDAWIKSCIEAQNGEIVVAGTKGSRLSGKGYHGVCAKLRDDGTLVWERAIEGNENSKISAVVQGSHGDYVLAGNSVKEQPDDKSDCLVACIDVNGEIRWINQYEIQGSQDVRQLLRCGDSSFVVVGSSSKVHSSFALKIDKNGTRVWYREFGSRNTHTTLGASVNNQSNIEVLSFGKSEVDHSSTLELHTLNDVGETVDSLYIELTEEDIELLGAVVTETHDWIAIGSVNARSSDSAILMVKLAFGSKKIMWRSIETNMPSDGFSAAVDIGGDYIVCGDIGNSRGGSEIIVMKVNVDFGELKQ